MVRAGWHWVALLAAALVTTEALMPGEAHLPGKLVEAYAAAGTVLLAQLFHPHGAIPARLPSVLRSLGWSAALGILAAALLLILSLNHRGIVSVARPAIAVALSAFALTSFTNLIDLKIHDRQLSHMITLALLVISGAAPLWLGPIAQWTTTPPVLINGIIASSPLTYFAVMADIDYLRSSWFYMHTPYGGLRYAYPAPGVYTLAYSLAALSFVFFTRYIHHKDIPRA